MTTLEVILVELFWHPDPQTQFSAALGRAQESGLKTSQVALLCMFWGRQPPRFQMGKLSLKGTQGLAQSHTAGEGPPTMLKSPSPSPEPLSSAGDLQGPQQGVPLCGPPTPVPQ